MDRPCCLEFMFYWQLEVVFFPLAPRERHEKILLRRHWRQNCSTARSWVMFRSVAQDNPVIVGKHSIPIKQKLQTFLLTTLTLIMMQGDWTEMLSIAVFCKQPFWAQRACSVSGLPRLEVVDDPSSHLNSDPSPSRALSSRIPSLRLSTEVSYSLSHYSRLLIEPPLQHHSSSD